MTKMHSSQKNLVPFRTKLKKGGNKIPISSFIHIWAPLAGCNPQPTQAPTQFFADGATLLLLVLS